MVMALFSCTRSATVDHTHPTLCLSFTETPLYLDQGIFISPLVVQLPSMGCTDTYAKRLMELLHQLDSPLLPAASHRNKRFAIPLISTLAALFSTISMGAGISNSVQLGQLTETIAFIGANQNKIKFELDKLTESVLEMQTAHHNSFLAIKQTATMAKVHSEYNSCQIGMNKMDSVIQSILTKSLTSHILPPDQITRYLSSNKVLMHSIYTINPRLVYELGKIELVNIDPEKEMFTVLLLLPHIQGSPDGRLFTPLHAPRFHVRNGIVNLESTLNLPSLFYVGVPPSPSDPLLSMDTSLCRFINKGAICPLAGQHFDEMTHCSNLIMRNASTLELEQSCHFSTHSFPGSQHTSLKESSTALLLFSNEETRGLTHSGSISIIPKNSPPTCILINKLHLASLVIGNKTFRMNIRTDVFEIPKEDASVVLHLHSVKTPLPFALKEGFPNLHPLSGHFFFSLGIVLSVCLLSILICATGARLYALWRPVKKMVSHVPEIENPERADRLVSLVN